MNANLALDAANRGLNEGLQMQQNQVAGTYSIIEAYEELRKHYGNSLGGFHNKCISEQTIADAKAFLTGCLVNINSRLREIGADIKDAYMPALDASFGIDTFCLPDGQAALAKPAPAVPLLQERPIESAPPSPPASIAANLEGMHDSTRKYLRLFADGYDEKFMKTFTYRIENGEHGCVEITRLENLDACPQDVYDGWINSPLGEHRYYGYRWSGRTKFRSLDPCAPKTYREVFFVSVRMICAIARMTDTKENRLRVLRELYEDGILDVTEKALTSESVSDWSVQKNYGPTRTDRKGKVVKGRDGKPLPAQIRVIRISIERSDFNALRRLRGLPSIGSSDQADVEFQAVPYEGGKKSALAC